MPAGAGISLGGSRASTAQHSSAPGLSWPRAQGRTERSPCCGDMPTCTGELPGSAHPHQGNQQPLPEPISMPATNYDQH